MRRTKRKSRTQQRCNFLCDVHGTILQAKVAPDPHPINGVVGKETRPISTTNDAGATIITDEPIAETVKASLVATRSRSRNKVNLSVIPLDARFLSNHKKMPHIHSSFVPHPVAERFWEHSADQRVIDLVQPIVEEMANVLDAKEEKGTQLAEFINLVSQKLSKRALAVNNNATRAKIAKQRRSNPPGRDPPKRIHLVRQRDRRRRAEHQHP